MNRLDRPNRDRVAAARHDAAAEERAVVTEPAGRVAGVVLAAGSSSRLGRNKLLLDVGGEALVRRTVRRAVAAGLDPVVVVVGHEAERVTAELAGVPCRLVVNPDHASGQSSSLQAGIAAVPPRRSPRWWCWPTCRW